MLHVKAQKWGDNLCFLWGQSDRFCQQRRGGFEKDWFLFKCVISTNQWTLPNAATHVVITCEVVPLLFDRQCVSLCAAGELLGSSERRLTQTMASFIREKLYVAQHQAISIQILSNPIYRLGKKTNIRTDRSWLDSTDNVQSLYKQLMTAEHKCHEWMYLKEVGKFGLTNFVLN